MAYLAKLTELGLDNGGGGAVGANVSKMRRPEGDAPGHILPATDPRIQTASGC